MWIVGRHVDIYLSPGMTLLPLLTISELVGESLFGCGFSSSSKATLDLDA